MSENKVPGKRYPAINDCNQTVMYDLGLDTVDTAILNWIAQFAASNHTNTLKQPDGMIYHWISYSKAQSDLFALRFNSKETFKYRLNKLCGENGDTSKNWPLKKCLDTSEKGNTKTYFALTAGYDELHTWKTYEELPTPEPEKDVAGLSEDFISLYTTLQTCSPFKKPLYKKDGVTPLKEFILCQGMVESLLKGTFIADWHVKIGAKQNPDSLKGMTTERIIQVCSQAPSAQDPMDNSLRNFFVRCYEPSKNTSGFLKIISNCNCTIPTVTMQKDVTVPKNLQSSIDILKKCKKFRAKDEKKLVNNLIALDDWLKLDYVWIDEFNHGKGHDFYGSVEDIVYNFVGIVNKWEKCTDFNESFFDMGSKAWGIYVRHCSEQGIILLIGDKLKKSMQLDKEIAESNRKLRERNALREEAGLPPSVIPTSDGKLPYEIENERLAAIKAAKKQVELDERKKVEEAMREKVRNGGSIL
jgi:hypothetical protein